MSAYRTPASLNHRRARLLAGCALITVIASPALAQTAFQAGHETVSGSVEFGPTEAIGSGLRDTVRVSSSEAVINWTPNDTGVGGGAITVLGQNDELRFIGSGGDYTVLNRVIPADPSRPIQFDGRVSSEIEIGYGTTGGGNIWFYSPGGIIAGSTSRFDVGSLVLSANDIAFANGLGDRILFSRGSDSKSAITIQPGAQLNASGNYIALVAPRIAQGGTLTVNGSAALVAAQSGSITIPISGGLFNISISDGSPVDAAGETTLTHSGTTAISDLQGSGDQRRIYMMAVPKNEAVTMLVSGNLGYDAASQAQVANGAIILSNGGQISFDSSDIASAGTINITGGDFQADVKAFAHDITVDTSTAALNFAAGLSLLSDSGAITLAATGGRSIEVAGDAMLAHASGASGGLSPLSVIARDGSTIHARNLSLSSYTIGANEDGYGNVAATSAVGGSLLVSAQGSTITIDENLTLNSSAQGGDGYSLPAGSGTGGIITVESTDSGRLTVGQSVAAYSSGTGGYSSSGTGGAGNGGTIAVRATNGSELAARSMDLEAIGRGGQANSVGGVGTGGNASISLLGGTFNSNGSPGRARIDASGLGGRAGQIGGAAQGGTAEFLLGSAFTADFSQGLQIVADALGGDSDIGGNATGGTARLSAGAGSLTINTVEGISTVIQARGQSGFGVNRSGDAQGGSASAILTGTTATMPSLTVDASALASDFANSDVIAPPSANGGNSIGGSTRLELTDAAVTLDRLAINSDGQGGMGFQATGGNGRGGNAVVAVTGGSLALRVSAVTARGTGGSDRNFANELPVAGNGTGGSISIDLANVTTAGLETFSTDASGLGGFGDTGGAGVGGAITLAARNGANLAASTNLALIAQGRGSNGFSSGGSATGGTITVSSAGGSMVTGPGAYRADGLGGSAESGAGAGSAQGGTIALTAAGGGFDFGTDAIEFTASGVAGTASAAGTSPTGRGGTINLALAQGASGDPQSSLKFGLMQLTANGSETNPFQDFVAPGASATGIGGSVSVNIGSGSLTGGELQMAADGSGGNGRTSARGGTGYSGRAEFAMTGGTAAIEGALVVAARAFGGQAPAEDSNGAVGSGGHAGVGTNPFGTGAGAFATLSGGRFAGSSIDLIADSLGAAGGNSNLYSSAPVSGVGGDAVGGTANLTTSGTATLNAAGVTISSRGVGGAGGMIEYGYGASPVTAGAGGQGSGGIAVANLGGATIAAPTMIVDAGGEGGAGGAFFTNNSGTPIIPPGVAGTGGSAAGGSVTIGFAANSATVDALSGSASGVGGAGGQGATGGAGGAARGGSVTVNGTRGAGAVTSTSLTANGTGGSGGAFLVSGGSTGANASGQGGIVTLAANDVPADDLPLSLDLGAAQLSADGLSASGIGANLSGRVAIQASGAGAAPVLRFASLSAHARGNALNPNQANGISVQAAGSPIAVNGGADFDSIGPIGFSFDGGGSLAATGAVGIVSSDTIQIDHVNRPANGASILASRLNAQANGRISGAGGLIRATETVEVRSLGSTVELAAADAPVLIVAAASDVTAGSLTGGSANVSAGNARPGDPFFGGKNATITGNSRLTGSLSVKATGDVIVAPAAQVIVDRGVTFDAGDDIIIGKDALVRAANNPPSESGYGASDPLQQASQLRLLAGEIYAASPIDGQVGSILIDGNVEAPNRTLFMSAGAVSATPTSRLTAGNLYVRLFNIPVADQVPSNDGGLLSGACLEGSVCLGTANVNGIVRIGEAGYQPINLRVGGGIDGTDVLLSARSIELGQAGVTNSIRASDSLVIASLGENLVLNGPIAVTGGNTRASVSTTGSIVGAEASLNAPATLDLTASGNITLAAINAPTIRTLDFSGNVLNPTGITASGTIAVGRIVTTSNLSLLAGGNIALGGFSTNGTATLSALNGSIDVTDDASAVGGIVATARTIALTGQNGLNVTQATATAGNLNLTARAGTLAAGSATATGAMALNSGGGLTFASLSGQSVTLSANGAASGGTINSTAGVDASGAQGLTVDTIAASGPVTLGASAGTVRLATDITTGGALRASGRSVDLRARGNLALDQGNATAGDIVLASDSGNVTLGDVTASNALTVTSPGVIAVNGAASGATIALTSKDLAIGSAGRLGSRNATTRLTLTSTADRMFLGDAAGTGYRIDADEFGRIATGGDLTIASSPSGAQASNYDLLDPAGTNIVIGSMVFDGAQLGPTGTFRVSSPRSIGFTGVSQFRNFVNGQTVTYSAQSDISLAAETGLVTVKDSNGGLAGTLRLEAQQVHAMSAKARREIAGLQLNEVRQLLGTNDQIENQGGYFQAGTIIVRIGRLAFIQNSGANGNDPTQRRGFSANNFTIEAAADVPLQVVVNGRIGSALGADVIGTATLPSLLDPQSGFNGCLANVSCAGAVIPPPEPSFDPTPILSSSRDQVRGEKDKDESEESLEAAQARPDPIIRFVDIPASRFDPLIDEPVTGAGNEDLWLTPTPIKPTP